MTPQMKLPPGATLVPDGSPAAAPPASAPPAGAVALPPGATLVQDGAAVAQGPTPGPIVNPKASDADIIRSFGYDPNVIQSSPRYQSDIKAHGSLGNQLRLYGGTPNAPLGEYTNLPVARTFSDLGHGVEDALNGVVQLARHGANKLGMLSDADVAYGDFMDRLFNQDYLQNVRQGQASPGVIHLGQWMFPTPGVGKAKTIVGAIVRGGIHGGIAGAEMPVESPEDFWAEKGKQVLTGGTIGATIPAVVGGATKIAQLGTTLTGGGAELPETVTGDVLAKFRAAMGTTPWEKLQDVQRAAVAGDKQAIQVLQSINQASTPGEITQASIQLQNLLTGQQSDRFYNDVEDLVNRYRLPPARLSQTQQALNAAEREARVGMKDQGLNATLRDLRSALTPPSPAVPAPSGLVSPSGQPIVSPAAPPPDMQANYGTTRKVISQLDDLIRTGHTGDGALITGRGIGQLQQLKNALEDDVQNYILRQNKPDIATAQQTADDFYRSVRVPFKDMSIAKAATTTESSQIWKKFIQADNPDKANKIYNALDAKGRAALQYQMLNDQIQRATDPVKGFDSGKFSRGMDDLEDAYKVTFAGSDKAAIDGMRNLVLQAAQVEAQPASAFRNLLPLGLGAPMVTMIPRSEKLLRYMMSVPAGRKFLYTAAGLKPATVPMQNLLNQVETAAAKWATAPQAQ